MDGEARSAQQREHQVREGLNQPPQYLSQLVTMRSSAPSSFVLVESPFDREQFRACPFQGPHREDASACRVGSGAFTRSRLAFCRTDLASSSWFISRCSSTIASRSLSTPSALAQATRSRPFGVTAIGVTASRGSGSRARRPRPRSLTSRSGPAPCSARLAGPCSEHQTRRGPQTGPGPDHPAADPAAAEGPRPPRHRWRPERVSPHVQVTPSSKKRHRNDLPPACRRRLGRRAVPMPCQR